MVVSGQTFRERKVWFWSKILKRKVTFDLVFEGWVESQKEMAFQMTQSTCAECKIAYNIGHSLKFLLKTLKIQLINI